MAAQNSLLLRLNDHENEAVALVMATISADPHLLSPIVQHWIDLYIDYSTDSMSTRPRVRGGMAMEVDSGQLDYIGSPNLPEHVRWAGRLMMARVRDQREEFVRIWDEEMPEADDEAWLCIFAVLDAVALTMQAMPRGYAIQHPAGSTACPSSLN